MSVQQFGFHSYKISKIQIQSYTCQFSAGLAGFVGKGGESLLYISTGHHQKLVSRPRKVTIPSIFDPSSSLRIPFEQSFIVPLKGCETHPFTCAGNIESS